MHKYCKQHNQNGCNVCVVVAVVSDILIAFLVCVSGSCNKCEITTFDFVQ